MAEHYLKRWRDAGLLHDSAGARISAWEAQHRWAIWLWALSGMGALAIGLGVVAGVAANWQEIPAAAKRAVDVLLTGLCAVFVFVAWQRDQGWPREIGALLLFGLVIGGIALIGQVYQLQSDPWQALATWLALSTPFLALVAFTRLVGALWLAAAVPTSFSAHRPRRRLIMPPAPGCPARHCFPPLPYLPASPL